MIWDTTACNVQLANTTMLPAATLATPAGSGCLHPTQLDILEGDPRVSALLKGPLAATVADWVRIPCSACTLVCGWRVDAALGL